jgi:hypothetical protein
MCRRIAAIPTLSTVISTKRDDQSGSNQTVCPRRDGPFENGACSICVHPQYVVITHKTVVSLIRASFKYRSCSVFKVSPKFGRYGTTDLCKQVRHERILYRVRTTAQKMRVWPLEAGLQEQASNLLKLLWSKAMVVSVKEKSRHRIVAGVGHGDERKRTTDEVSKI